jgi:hypothetical protein
VVYAMFFLWLILGYTAKVFRCSLRLSPLLACSYSGVKEAELSTGQRSPKDLEI